jgi:hypothetical protein
MVCWIPLLHWIHETTGLAIGGSNYEQEITNQLPYQTRLPAIVFREQSWDFQPPDVVRPLAKISLSDIAVLARRMGMTWKEFRPTDGVLRAEGHSHIITSTMVRSLGIVLQYSYTGQGRRLQQANVHLQKPHLAGSLFSEQEEIYIPSAKADRLGCGVVRTHPLLGVPDFSLSTQGEIVAALSYLDSGGASSAALTRILKENPDFRFRVADIVAFTVKSVRPPGCGLVQVPAPSDNVRGVTTSAIGRRAFRQSLEEYMAENPQKFGHGTIRALEICEDIGTEYAAWDQTDEFAIRQEQWVVTRDVTYLDKVQEIMYALTLQMIDWEKESSLRFPNLLALHIRLAMLWEEGETSVLRSWKTDYVADVKGYFSQLPLIVEQMAKQSVSEVMCVDAWCTMMVRGMCWGATHFFVPGERVPIEYFGSQLPVYIG